MPETDTRYDVHVHCVRKRLCDPDGISAKAAIDAIVRDPRTIFKDDSAKYFRQISFTQERGEVEQTIIEFKTVEEE